MSTGGRKAWGPEGQRHTRVRRKVPLAQSEPKPRAQVDKRSAVLTDDGMYRYLLRRQWLECSAGEQVLFIMLNPSTADANEDDATIRRCTTFAKDWGYPALEVVNLFAYRATDPADLYLAPAPFGPLNRKFVMEAARRAKRVVAAWGRHGEFCFAGEMVRRWLAVNRIHVHALALCQNGEPAHPLRLSKKLVPVRLADLYRDRNRVGDVQPNRR